MQGPPSSSRKGGEQSLPCYLEQKELVILCPGPDRSCPSPGQSLLAVLWKGSRASLRGLGQDQPCPFPSCPRGDSHPNGKMG